MDTFYERKTCLQAEADVQTLLGSGAGAAYNAGRVVAKGDEAGVEERRWEWSEERKSW